jgi:hypothetical protein
MHLHVSGQLSGMFEITAKTFGDKAPFWRAED